MILKINLVFLLKFKRIIFHIDSRQKKREQNHRVLLNASTAKIGNRKRILTNRNVKFFLV